MTGFGARLELVDVVGKCPFAITGLALKLPLRARVPVSRRMLRRGVYIAV